MAQPTVRRGGKKNRKHGRDARKPKTTRYKSRNQRVRNKLKRVLRSNGLKYAERWARDNDCVGMLSKLVRAKA